MVGFLAGLVNSISEVLRMKSRSLHKKSMKNEIETENEEDSSDETVEVCIGRIAVIPPLEFSQDTH